MRLTNYTYLLTPLAYRGVFNQALTVKELYHWQYRTQYRISRIKADLPKLVQAKIVYQTGDLFGLRPFKLSTQLKRRRVAHLKQVKARQLLTRVRLPLGVVLVGLSGSVAAGFSRDGDDIDLVIVTRPGSLWLTRLQFYLTNPRLPRRRPGQQANLTDRLCLNLWLESHRLRLPANLFFATELLNFIPIYDPFGVYHRWLKSNNWIKELFPVGYSKRLQLNAPGGLIDPPWLKLIKLLNRPAYYLQRLYMSPKQTTERISYQTAFFHTTDQGRLILKKLAALLKQTGLSESVG